MTTRSRTIFAGFVLALGIVARAGAQETPVKVKEEKPGMLKLAKVTPEAATQTAQARFPTATITSAEIEKEKGKLIYTFDLQQPGVSGIEEVNIDALTGVIVATEHENPAPPKPKTRTPKPKPPTA